MGFWHRRLGHLDERDIATLARDPPTGIMISGVKLLGFCDTSEAAPMIKDYVAMIKATSGRSIDCNHSDGGRESLIEFYSQKGIQKEVTLPHTPEQNGPAERATQILFERVRSLLVDSGLPKKLWREAAKAVVMMINLSDFHGIIWLHN
ncbi:hypothetical protein VTO42DRAFT_6196 [Malbranchea cinnamomea]